jgi:RNA polymerase sigma factor (TIGR02999 family)
MAEAEVDNGVELLLAAVERGENGALDKLVVAIYPDLKRLANYHLANERHGHTLNTTAIVHEAFVRLASGNGEWSDRGHFLRAASTVMRHLLVDYARKRTAEKRGAGVIPIEFKDDYHATSDDSLAVLALDHAIKEIVDIDPRLEQIIECRYFAGLSVKETAEALGMAIRTVERDCQRTRAYLHRAMGTDIH